MNVLNRHTLERLLLYYHYLVEHVDLDPTATFSSIQLARVMQMDDTQVRKDFGAIGVKGCPRIGYRCHEVTAEIRKVLGFDEPYHAVVLGAGRLGSALVCYNGFREYGMSIVAVFDADAQRTGMVVGGHVVQPMSELTRVVQQRRALLGILAVPAEAAQELADRLIDAGVAAIWSFAPTHVNVPENVLVRHEHLSIGLAELAYHLKRLRQLPEDMSSEHL